MFVAAQQLRSLGYTVDVATRGIPTAVISPRVQALGEQHDREIFGNFIDQLAPFVPHEATVVTIFAGPNDVNVITAALGNGAGGSNPSGYIDDQVRAFGDDYAMLLDVIRGRAGAARLIALNLPNMGALPSLAGAGPAQRRAAQRASVGMTTSVINPLASAGTARVVDLMCDPRMYVGSTYSSDGFHPNDAGYAIFAAEVLRAVTAESYPAPRSSCPQMTQVP